MVIRCERCSTLYELDEALLAPEGSPVQCTRCEHVFTAFPARAPGRTLVGVPAAPAPEPAAAPAAEVPPQAPSPPAPERMASSPSARGFERPAAEPAAAERPPAEPRVARPQPPPVYRPAPPPAGVRPAPLIRRDPVGAFESRLRWSARWRWLAPAVAAVVLAAVVGGWLALRGRTDPAAERAHVEGLALVALDDADSLDQALSRFDDALHRSPSLRAAAADRALAQVLRASALEEDAEAAAARMRERSQERERLQREQPPRWEEQGTAAAQEIRRLEPEVRALEERSRALSQSAREALRTLESEIGDDPAVARALAVHHALAGERDRALRVVRVAREGGRGDPWLDLAEAALDLRGDDRAARERGLAKLAPIVAKHPELLRARYLFASAQAGLARRAEASAAVSEILSANPRHEGARRLRDALAAPLAPEPAGPVAAPPTPAAAVVPASSPPENAAPPPRNAVAHPVTAGAAPAPATTAPAPVSPMAAPSSPAASAASATRSPAAAEASRGPRPPLAAPRMPADPPAREGALAPASIPDTGPASGAPLVAPREVEEEPPAARSLYQDEVPGGG